MSELGPYLISLPERVVRSLTGLAGGLARQIGDVAVPAVIRRTRLYRSLVDSTLRFLIEQVGQVEGTYPNEAQLAKNFLLRRTAGNGIEALGILAFSASPVWIMAALADLTGAGRHLVAEIGAAMKEEGLLEGGGDFESVDQILNGLEGTAARLAETFNTPPLDVASLREEWAALQREAARIPPAKLPQVETLSRTWQSLKQEAAAQRTSVFTLSSVMAAGAVARLPGNLRKLSRAARVAAGRTGRTVAAALLDHYSETLKEIRKTGYLAYWTREFRPYLRAAASQFSPRRKTISGSLWRTKRD